jgi:UDP-galactopyranose mutase
MKKIGIVGAGFSGAVIARELALSGYKVDVFDSRSHVAGNCHTERDPETNIMVHKYGPHIFHTSNEKIWKYVNQFDEFMPFTNRVKAIYKNNVYSLPINLLTINNFFKKTFSPDEASHFIKTISLENISEPISFEEQALKFIGNDLYEAFLKGYTIKQWGLHPSKLPASILKRLPVRFNYDDNYYSSAYQGMPKNGYTHIVQQILNHENINLVLSTDFHRDQVKNYEHVFSSGTIDSWFEHSIGRLAYRTLDFKLERHKGDFQGNPVMNYCDEDVPWTRITEFKHFSPWESNDQTLIFKEFSRACEVNDIPYYPIRLVEDKILLNKYIELAKAEKNVTFIGRLGTYRYLDMHITIAEALDAAASYLHAQAKGIPMNSFVINPEA